MHIHMYIYIYIHTCMFLRVCHDLIHDCADDVAVRSCKSYTAMLVLKTCN